MKPGKYSLTFLKGISIILFALFFTINADAQRRGFGHEGNTSAVRPSQPMQQPSNNQPRMFSHSQQPVAAPRQSQVPVNNHWTPSQNNNQPPRVAPVKPVTNQPVLQPVTTDNYQSPKPQSQVTNPPPHTLPVTNNVNGTPAAPKRHFNPRPGTAPAAQNNINPAANSVRPASTVNTQNRWPAYNAYNPGWRYSNLPRRNARVQYVPAGYRNIYYGGYNYRYCNGIFYRPYNNEFITIAPPFGIYIDVLPFGYRQIYVRNRPYYYYYGSYYDYHNNNYYVVSPPVGAVVESLPEGYESIIIDGETYYKADGAQYKPVVQDNGEIWYEVIKSNS